MERKASIIEIKILSLLLAFMAFMAGGLIYLGFRSSGLRLFRWADALGLSGPVYSFRNIAARYHSGSSFVDYSLPDGLWVLSYILVIETIWDFKPEGQWWIVLFIPVAAIISEILQGTGVLNGTYDFIDIITYLVATIIGLLICRKFNTITTIQR